MSVPRHQNDHLLRERKQSGCSCIIKDAVAFLYSFYFFPLKALPFLPLNKRELSYPVTVFQKTSSKKHMRYEYTATETSGVDSPKLPFVTSGVLILRGETEREAVNQGCFAICHCIRTFKKLHEQPLSDLYQFSCKLHWWVKCQVFCRKCCIRIDTWSMRVSTSWWWRFSPAHHKMSYTESVS